MARRKFSQARKERNKQQTARGCLIPFSGVFILAGLAVFVALTVVPLWRIVDARDWERVPCTIASSRLDVSHGSDSTSYRIDIGFDYSYGAQTYRGTRYNFSVGHSSGRRGKQRVVDAHPVGMETFCFVDPDAPESSVIDRDVGAFVWFGLFGLIFVAAGCFVLFFGVIKKPSPTRRARRRYGKQRKKRHGNLSGRPRTPEFEPGRPIELKPVTSPWGKVVGVTFVALFWNGIVSVFVWQALQGDAVFLWIFLIPFLLIGAALLVAVPYQVLAAYNPRPVITLQRAPHVGSEQELHWYFEGNVSRMRTLKLEILGEESATYQRGTNTVTDTEVFHRTVLLDTQNPEEIGEGLLRFAIPAGTMATWEASHNRVQWKFKLHGDVPRWPDVKEEYLFPVHHEDPGVREEAALREHDEVTA